MPNDTRVVKDRPVREHRPPLSVTIVVISSAQSGYTMRIPRKISFVISVIVGALLLTASAVGQDGRPRGNAKPVTVPVTIRLRDAKPVEMRFVDYLLRE